MHYDFVEYIGNHFNIFFPNSIRFVLRLVLVGKSLVWDILFSYTFALKSVSVTKPVISDVLISISTIFLRKLVLSSELRIFHQYLQSSGSRFC